MSIEYCESCGNHITSGHEEFDDICNDCDDLTPPQTYVDKEVPFELWKEYQLKLKSQYHKNPIDEF